MPQDSRPKRSSSASSAGHSPVQRQKGKPANIGNQEPETNMEGDIIARAMAAAPLQDIWGSPALMNKRSRL
jgi:hypothetical protein